MIWTILSSVLTASGSFFYGNRRLFSLYQITARNLLVFVVLVLAVYSFLLFLYQKGIVGDDLGEAFITNTYASVFGFFGGAAWNQFRLKSKAGKILYVNRTFLSDHFPIIIALGLVLFGIYRMSIVTELVITPIRIASGLSLIGIGLWGMTLRFVPEFRSTGIILLDTLIDWEQFLNYHWYLEDVIEVEYEKNGSIKSFKTLIPPEDQQEVESILRKKMLEKVEEKL